MWDLLLRSNRPVASNAMESNTTQEFFLKTYGLFGKIARWIGFAGMLAGLLILIFGGSGRGKGVQMLVTGAIVVAVTRSQKHPFIILTPEAFSIRMGMGKKYQTIAKEQIERIDITDKAITVMPKKGRKIKLGRRLFSKEVWAQMQEPVRAFVRSVRE